MKRLYIAAALLALLLGASLANAWYVQGMADGMRDRLEQAQALTRQGDWERAEALTGKPQPLSRGDRVAAKVISREGALLDTIRTLPENE